MSTQKRSARRIRNWADWEASVQDKSCTEAEQKLVDACREGNVCSLNNGQYPTSPSDKNTIGADLLRYLITGGCERCDLADWGVDLRGAYISGALDLRMISAFGVTAMTNCHFEKRIEAMNADLAALILSGSSCPALNAQGIRVKSNMFLRNGFTANGAVSLSGADIGGQLACSGGAFKNEEGTAFNASGIRVTGSVFLSDGFEARGEVNLTGASIGSQLNCAGGHFSNSAGHALKAQAVQVKGGIVLSSGFSADGEVSLSGAVVGGQLICSAGSFECKHSSALNAEGAEITLSVFFNEGFKADGEVRLTGAVIGGHLTCSGGRFNNPENDAFDARTMQVDGNVYLGHGARFTGQINISGSVIRGDLICTSGRFENKDGKALNAQTAELNGFFWIGVNFCEGSLDLSDVKARNLTDDDASWRKVSRSYLDGFEYQTIHGPLDAEMRLNWLKSAVSYSGSFSPQPYEQLGRSLKKMGHSESRRSILIEKEKRQRQFEMAKLRMERHFARKIIQLSNAHKDESLSHIDEILHDIESHKESLSYGDVQLIKLLAKRYSLLHTSWADWARNNRIPDAEIARAQAGFREGIYANIKRINMRIFWLKVKDGTARHLVGYGYSPFKFVWSLTILVFIGWIVSHIAYTQGDFAPNSDVILSTDDWQTLAEGGSINPASDWAALTGKGRDYESFNSFAYAVDIVIPIVGIGQEAAWSPSTNRGPWGATLWWLRWFLIILGWIVTAVGAAAITGVIRRE